MRLGLLIGFFLSISSQAFALTAEWNRNTEADVKEYGMYMCETANCTVSKSPAMLKATIPQTVAGVSPTWPMPDGKIGAIAVTAKDQSGNESPLSNTVVFDTATPGTPTGLTIKLSVAVQLNKVQVK